MNPNKVTVLDCTLRDGGYVNNWGFTPEDSMAVMDALYASGVRVIELGLMGRDGLAGKQTKFTCMEDARLLLNHRKPDCSYAIMLTQAESEFVKLPHCSKDTVDIVRLAYFKQECHAAMKTAKKLKNKGYRVFMQAMATFLYNEQELKWMIEQINELKPEAFYMVDSFSTMYPEEVKRRAERICTDLSEDICFGLHAHNNMQMAFANAIEFMKVDRRETIYVDGSIFGMGRGAGNVPTELLGHYCNETFGTAFDMGPILKVCQDVLLPIYRQYGWGYTLPNLLTAVKKMNSAYAWFLMNHGIFDIEQLNRIMDMIPNQCRYTLMKDVITDAIQKDKEANND